MRNQSDIYPQTTVSDFRPQISDTLQSLSNNPLVSIIVPSYNQGAFIKETVDSILTQNYRPVEVLIIDGASTDNTLDVLHQYDSISEVNWISEPDSGIVEAVNKGFDMANGEICAIQSSDDFYLSGAIQRGVQELLNKPSLGLVFGDIIKIDADGNELMKDFLKPFTLENILTFQTWIPQPSCFFRLLLAKRLGGWRDNVSYAADTDLWMRILLNADAKKIDTFMAKRRIHENQRDIHGDRIIRDYSQIIRDLFDIYNAPTYLRPAAEAGILLLTNRYTYNEEKRIKIQRMQKALKIYPPLKDKLMLPSKIPGVELTRAVVRGVRRKFFWIV